MEDRKVKLTISFEGTRYSGWQFQKIGTGVQEIIQEAFAGLYGTAFAVHGSSRTDTGVHALAMIAHVRIPRDRFVIPIEKLALALNSKLPPDIRIQEAKLAPPQFHARFNARGKQYRYILWNARTANPLLRHTAWHFPRPLDVPVMRRAAKHLVGKHDFKSFANCRHYEMKSTVRTLHRCDIRRSGPQLTIILEGDGFLYKMCRSIVGTLVQVGLKKFTPEDIPAILENRNRTTAGVCAPPQGLVLWKVFY